MGLFVWLVPPQYSFPLASAPGFLWEATLPHSQSPWSVGLYHLYLQISRLAMKSSHFHGHSDWFMDVHITQLDALKYNENSGCLVPSH